MDTEKGVSIESGKGFSLDIGNIPNYTMGYDPGHLDGDSTVFSLPKQESYDIKLNMKHSGGLHFDLSGLQESPNMCVVLPSNKPKPRKRRANKTKSSRKHRKFYKQQLEFKSTITDIKSGDVMFRADSPVKTKYI